jgi:hypothetical protein
MSCPYSTCFACAALCCGQTHPTCLSLICPALQPCIIMQLYFPLSRPIHLYLHLPSLPRPLIYLMISFCPALSTSPIYYYVPLFSSSPAPIFFLLHYPQLLDMGIVYKENFDEEEDSKFHMDMYSTEKRENAAMREKKEREDKARESSAKAFDDWVQLKGIRDQALRCLGLLDPPVLSVGARELGLGSAGGPRSAWTSTATKGQGPRDEGLKLVIDVRLAVGVLILMLMLLQHLIWSSALSPAVFFVFSLSFLCRPLSLSPSILISFHYQSEGSVLLEESPRCCCMTD